MNAVENPLEQFWHYVSQRLQIIENIQLIMPELSAFKTAHPNLSPDELAANADFQNLSNHTKTYLEIVSYMSQIDPRISCLVGMNMVQLHDKANQIVLAEKRRELEEQDIEVPQNLKVVPAYARYEFILVTGDPECVPLINNLYTAWKGMIIRGEIQNLDDWTVIKFRPPLPDHVPASRTPLAYKGEIVPPGVMKYIVQKPYLDKPVSQTNPVECVFWLHMAYVNGRFNTQTEVDEFKMTILQWIDTKIGDYRSFTWIRSISIVPSPLWDQVAQNFPEHYQRKDWDHRRFVQDLKDILPPSKKCRFCNLHEENTTLIPILQPYKCMPAGDYCQYCFSLYSRIVEKDPSNNLI